MYSDIDKQMKRMMLKYLEKAYPVARIKHNHKFRRAIVLDGGVYILGDDSSFFQLKTLLTKELNKVFDCDDIISCVILDNFLNIKKQASRPLK